MVRRLQRQDGFTTPLVVVVFSLMVLVIGGISVDLWRVLADHREVAGWADGAAIAGATAVDLEKLRDDPSQPPQLDRVEAIDRACQYLASQAGVTDCPAPAAGVTVAAERITVRVTSHVELFMLKGLAIFDPESDTSPIQVSAVADAVALRGAP